MTHDFSRVRQRTSQGFRANIGKPMPFVLLAMIACSILAGSKITHASTPNVLLIMTDDQGFGDVSQNGNPILSTPSIDRIASEGVRIDPFYVSPVCTPTRASLMTGRYHIRTKAIDTYLGRAMMNADETTLAEALAAGGYRTGIFGKWHLGDNYPMRAVDQGFQESLVHRGGGLAQPAGLPDETYFDPELLRDGKPVRAQGYCTDIFADAACDFIRRNAKQPWLTYLPFNAPHDPLQVPPEEAEVYREKNLSGVMTSDARPVDRADLKDRIALTYGMIRRIDSAIGKVLRLLDELKLADNTIVVFLTDNGPVGGRYNAGMRGRKGTLYEGGIRVPCFIRWPRRLAAGSQVAGPAAHIDLMPTLLSACNVSPPPGVSFDGVNILPILEGKASNPPERMLFQQWHRGEIPERFRSFMVRGPRYKLVHSDTARPEFADKFELFDLQSDPNETTDISQQNPGRVAEMKQAYAKWFDDVAGANWQLPRIVVGSEHEKPVRLSRQDWRGPDARWDKTGNGYWDLNVVRPGQYRVTLEFPATNKATNATLTWNDRAWTKPVPAGASRVQFDELQTSAGPSRLQGTLNGGSGAHYVTIDWEVGTE